MTDQNKWRHDLSEVTPYLSIGVQLAATMVVYVGIGWLIDWWQDTAPTFLIVGSIVGMIAFFVQLVRLSRDLTARNDAARGKKDTTG